MAKELIFSRISSLRLIKQDMDIDQVIAVAISYETRIFRECADKVSNHSALQTVALNRPLYSKLY